MPITKDNSVYEKTSFLSKNNDAFIESMYLKYISNDSELPQGWKEFFDELGEEKKNILNEIKGPSWSPKKIDITKIVDQKKISAKDPKTIKYIRFFCAFRKHSHIVKINLNTIVPM